MSIKKTENAGRNYSWAIFAVIILIAGAAITGIIAYVGDIKSNTRQKAIEEYANSVVNFTVFGEGIYTEESPSYGITTETDPSTAKILMGELTGLGLMPVKKPKAIYAPDGYMVISVETTQPDKVVALLDEYELPYACAYIRNDAFASVGNAYDLAYESALKKAGMIAQNTGLAWSIKNVTEMESSYDPQNGTTYSKVSMTLAVDGNSLKK